MYRIAALASFALMLLGAGRSTGADAKQAEGVLREKGLRRTGSLYLLPVESKLSKTIRSAQALRKELAAVSMESRMTARGAADGKKLIAALSQQRIQLRQQRALAATAEQYNEITNALNDLADRINFLQAGREDPEATKQREAAFARRREAYLQAVLDARNLVSEAEAAYATLAEDGGVKAALEELNRSRKDKLRLGPSRSFKADVKSLEALEGTIDSETIPLRDVRGNLWVDIVFNGKVTRAMVFDTGASLVNLPIDMAVEVGLKITDDLPTVEAQVADGGIVKAKLTRIPSMRLGKFAAQDVECTVMNGSRDDVPPLLGMSFLKHFIYKLDPANSTLTLTRVGGDPTEPRSGPAPKGSAKAKGEKAGVPTSASDATEGRPGEVGRFEGHTAQVGAVAWSRDARHAISGGADNTIRVWDVRSLKESLRIDAGGGIAGLAATADGRAVVSAGSDRTVRRWDLKTGDELRRDVAHSDGVHCVAISPDGHRLLTGGKGELLLWDFATGRGLFRLQGNTDWVRNVAFAPDSRRAVSANGEGVARLWDLELGREVRRFEGHAAAVAGVAFTPDGRRVLTGSYDATLRLWDAESGRELRKFEGHAGHVNTVAIAADGRRALSGGGAPDNSVRLWDLESGRELHRFEGHADGVTAVAIAPDGRRALSSAADKTVRVWSLPSGDPASKP